MERPDILNYKDDCLPARDRYLDDLEKYCDYLESKIKKTRTEDSAYKGHYCRFCGSFVTQKDEHISSCPCYHG